MAKQRLSKLQRLILDAIIAHYNTENKFSNHTAGWWSIREEVYLKYAGEVPVYAGGTPMTDSFRVSFCRSIYNLHDKGLIIFTEPHTFNEVSRYNDWGCNDKDIDITEEGLIFYGQV